MGRIREGKPWILIDLNLLIGRKQQVSSRGRLINRGKGCHAYMYGIVPTGLGDEGHDSKELYVYGRLMLRTE
jgi:hypothetical protein